MNTFPDNEIEEVNEMLHKLLGNSWVDLKNFKFKNDDNCMFEGEGFMVIKQGDVIKRFTKEETFKILKACQDEIYLKVFKFLNFYYPRWIAFNIIKESDDKYSDFSSNNELLIALTSIIDCLSVDIWSKRDYLLSLIKKPSNIFFKKDEIGFSQKFISFIKKNLSKNELEELTKDYIISRKKGKNKTKKLKTLKEFAEYIYKIRSLIVHTAELGGIYPDNISFDFNFEKRQVDNVVFMIDPKIFRRLLWKAIFNSLGLNIIY